jgi:hypothetical protein
MSTKIHRRQFVACAGTAALGLAAPAILHAAEGDWSDLVGRFVYEGKAPERKKLKVDKDVECCGKFDIRDETLIVGPDGGLENVFVYVRSRNVAVHPDLEKSLSKRVTLDNRDCLFKPRCLTIWYPKQEFYIVNSDPVAQNVAYSPMGDTPANIVIPVGKDATWKFGRRQLIPVPIACNYHPWESGYVLPREDPYAAVSAKDGTFRIAKLPAGKPLEFQVWHERVGYLETPEWTKGRFQLTLKPGVHDLGAIKLAPAIFAKK